MKESCDPVLQEDIEVIAGCISAFPELSGAAVAVTGATGLLGSILVKSLLAANRLYGMRMAIYALARNLNKAEKAFAECLDRAELKLIHHELAEKPALPFPVDYIIHGAASTASADFVNKPVEVAKGILTGTMNMLDLAWEKQVKSMVFLSSMEAYGAVSSERAVAENELGDIDLTSVRSCYPESKRMAENLCACYFSQYQLPVKAARLAQTFGAGADREDGRVFAQFARAVTDSHDIVLHTDGKTVRNCCYTSDALCGIIYLLCRGENGETYNIANPDTALSIYDTARLVADRLAHGKIKVVTQKTPGAYQARYNPQPRLIQDIAKIKKLGWTPQVSLLEMYRRLIVSFSSRKREG